MVTNKKFNMGKPQSIRLTSLVEKNIKELKKAFPEDYKNKSSVIRSGVMQLHKQKILNKNKFFGEV